MIPKIRQAIRHNYVQLAHYAREKTQCIFETPSAIGMLKEAPFSSENHAPGENCVTVEGSTSEFPGHAERPAGCEWVSRLGHAATSTGITCT
jgi:hypothetical protein